MIKDQMNVSNVNREDGVKTEDGDNRVQDMIGERNVIKKFDAILKDIKKNGETTESVSVKDRGDNINLQPLITKLLNAEKPELKKEYGFDEAFNIFDETDNKPNKLSEYNPRTPDKIGTKSIMLEYLKITEDRLINMISTPGIVRKINNVNHKGYVRGKSKYKIDIHDSHHAEATLNFLKFKDKKN